VLGDPRGGGGGMSVLGKILLVVSEDWRILKQ
jgi:hypothetical protein